MTEPVFILGLTIAATTLVLVAKAIAGAIAGRGASRSELAEIKQRFEEHAGARTLADGQGRRCVAGGRICGVQRL